MSRHLLCIGFIISLTLHAHAALLEAYAPIVAASKQREAAAQKALADWRAKRDSLTKQWKAVEAKLLAFAPAADAALVARLKALDAELKAMKPAQFTAHAQFVAYDRLTDERARLVKAMAQAESARLTAARRQPGAKALAAEWEKLQVQVVAAENEMAFMQARRDSIIRAEKGVIRTITPQPEVVDPKAERRRLVVPAPADAAVRRAEFARRNSPEGVREVGERFFSQMTLTLPGLEEVAQLVKAGRHDAALEAYKRYFFAKLLAAKAGDAAEPEDDDEGNRDGEATLSHSVFPPPSAAEIQRALDGVAVETVTGKTPVRVEAVLGQPGALPWVFAAVDDEVQLTVCRRLGYPGKTGDALLHSYAVGGPREHLVRWSEILDDWTLNWRRDVERSPLPVRDYNLLYVCRLQGTRDKLRTLSQMRPSFVADLPAATFARWLMAMNEEYVASAIRLGRSGLYNFRIMALNSMLPTSLAMQEFHIHRWAVREGWRQVDNNFIYKIRRDGANFEFANDGHENTDQFMTLPFHALREWNRQPEWLEPFWQEEFMDNFLGNARYRVHNVRPDGWCYRLSVRQQRGRYIGERPEYKVNLLAHEDELRRRLWKVFRVGQPEPEPRIASESLAFQGYSYLRAGWEPEDDFLFFQTIGQPILSGREESTGFSLSGGGSMRLLNPATTVDGRIQNAHHGLVMNPGGKAPFACYGRNEVKTNRFHAGAQFDFTEGEFAGVYSMTHPRDAWDVFGLYGYESALAKAQSRAQKAGKEYVDEPIRGVRQARQVIALRGKSAYLVTDLVQSEQLHRFTQDYTIYTPVRAEHLEKRVALRADAKPFTADAAARILTTHNAGLPDLQLRHFSALPLEYRMGRNNFGDDQKKMSKRERQQGDVAKLVQFSQQVAVDWQGRGAQMLVTLVQTGEPLRDVRPLAPGVDSAGFTGTLADGTAVAYLAAATPRELTVGGVQANAAALLVVGTHGLALDCTRIAGLAPESRDFVFRVEQGKVVLGEPIYRPIQPVVISPEANVFTDTATVTLTSGTPGVEIHYTLDGSRPVPSSPRYTAPFTVDKTCRVQARAFRQGVTEDVWQQDGTHATVVSSAVLRKETPRAPVAPASTAPGLRYEYFAGIWTEVMARSLTMPAQKTGVLPKLLDVSPRATDGGFGLRYDGFLEVPHDGVYTFHAPREFLFPDNDCGYDLRVFVAGLEWNPAVRWHAHGTWSIALKAGKHPIRVAYADLRLRPHKVELMWGFPHPDFTWKGTAPELHISGPDLAKQRIPDALLSHVPN